MTTPARHASTVLTGGRFYRDGGWLPDVDTLVAVGGRVTALGRWADLRGVVGPTTRVVDVGGGHVLPGLQDAHLHPVQAGLEMNACDLTAGEGAADHLATVARYASDHPDAPWILGGGWSMDHFERGVPTAAALDAVVPDRPVFLPNRDHHSAWVNTVALELAGVTASTPDPRDGRIERAPDGSPTGALHEGAMALVAALVPVPTAVDLEQALLTAQRHLFGLGLTGWQDALVGTGLGMSDTLDTYLALRRDGRLVARVVAAQWWDRHRGLEQLDDLLERRERAAAAGVDASTVKVMQDGVCETFTAAVLDPYLDVHGHATDNRGLSFLDAADLAACVAMLDAHDFQVHVHALGDRAVRDSLDAVEHARRVNGPRGNRHHLAHLQIVHPDDVARFAALDVTANAQPLWACHEPQLDTLTLPFLSPQARRQQYVFGSLRDAGARLAFGTDWPVSPADPWAALHVAVNRVGPGDDLPPLGEGQGLPVVAALDAYTRGSAWVNRLDADAGEIAVGRLADLTVVDHDVLAIEPVALASTRTTHTVVGGVVVHEA